MDTRAEKEGASAPMKNRGAGGGGNFAEKRMLLPLQLTWGLDLLQNFATKDGLTLAHRWKVISQFAVPVVQLAFLLPPLNCVFKKFYLI